MENPAISVIMPVWNTAEYLHQAVDSVLEQSFEDWELILIDDGSTDGSGRICDQYAEIDPRIRVIHQENRGQSEARNAGIREAAGEYLQFLDSDDWLFRYALGKMIGKAEETGADMVIFDLQHESGGNSWHEQSSLEEGIYPSDLILLKLSCTQIPPYACNKFSRSSLYDGVSFPSGAKWEDAGATFYPVSRAEKIAVLPEPLYHYRQRADSVTKLAMADRSLYMWRFYQYRRRYDFLKEEYPEIAEAAKFTVLDNGIKYYAYCLQGDENSAERKKIRAYLSDKDMYSSKYSLWYKTKYFLFRFFPRIAARFTRTYMKIMKNRRTQGVP